MTYPLNVLTRTSVAKGIAVCCCADERGCDNP